MLCCEWWWWWWWWRKILDFTLFLSRVEFPGLSALTRAGSTPLTSLSPSPAQPSQFETSRPEQSCSLNFTSHFPSHFLALVALPSTHPTTLTSPLLSSPSSGQAVLWCWAELRGGGRWRAKFQLIILYTESSQSTHWTSGGAMRYYHFTMSTAELAFPHKWLGSGKISNIASLMRDLLSSGPVAVI